MSLSERQKRNIAFNKGEEQRKRYAMDIIQPSDNRFKTHYRKQWLENEATEEKMENKAKDEKKSKDDFLKKFRHNIVERNLAKQVLNKEEEHGN